MTLSSKQAYANPSNRERRESHKRAILRFYREEAHKGTSFTIRELAWRLNMSYNQVQKRTHDPHREGLLDEDGKKLENGNPNTLYRLRDAFDDFKLKKTKFQLLKDAIFSTLSSEEAEKIMRIYNEIK